MFKTSFIALGAVATLTGFSYFSSDTSPNIDKMMASTVKIVIENAENNEEIGHGSGVILENGLILTVNHVISDEKRDFKVKIVAKQQNGDTFELETVKGIAEKDMAFMKAKDKKIRKNYSDIACVSKLRVGQNVISMGNPTALEFITTFGRIAGLKQHPEFVDYDIIITDLSMAPGMSGGPVFNEDGEVVGLNDAMLTYSTGIALSPNNPEDPSKGVKPAPIQNLLGISMLVPADDICEEMAKLKNS